MNRQLVVGVAALTALEFVMFSNPVWASGKFASPVQNTFTISFDDPSALSPGMTDFKATSNFDVSRNWDDSYAGEVASWGTFGGRPDEIYAGVAADAGPNGAGDNAARLYIPSNDGGGYFANLSWQVKGLQLGNSLGGMEFDTVTNSLIPLPSDGFGDYSGISLTVNAKTDIPNATFRFNFDTGQTGNSRTADDGEGGTVEWVVGNIPGLIEQNKSGSRVYLVSPGDLPVNTWSTSVGIVNDEDPSDANGWANATFEPFYSRNIKSFDLTRVGVTFPGGGQVGELLVGDFTMSGPDILKYHAADFNYDEMVDDLDIDMLFAAINADALNDTLPEVPPGILGAFARVPVFGEDFIPNAKAALAEKFSITTTDENVLDLGDVDELVLNILGTQYGDLDLNGTKDASDLDTLTANLGNPGGWADGDLNGDGMVDNEDLAIFGDLGLPADFNKDGIVDGNDFLVWQAGFNMFDGNATPNDGDANGDGNVDGNDFLIWQSSFGSSGGNGAAVPEPTAVVLGVLLLCSLGVVGRRSR